MSYFFDVTDENGRTLRVGTHGGVGMNSMARSYLLAYGLPLRLRDTGRFDPACIGEVCEKAVNDGAIIVNPAYLSKEDVAKLLLAAQ